MINRDIIGAWQNWLIIAAMIYIPLAGWRYIHNKTCTGQNAH